VAGIEWRARNGQPRWYARYRDLSGEQLVKVFDRKRDAARFLTTTEASDDEAAGRAAMGESMRTTSPLVCPMCTQISVEEKNCR
jgi:hypothetical protein